MTHNCDRVLAVDIGTSSVRAMVFDPSGEIKARSQIEYGVLRPEPYHEEQDPDILRSETFRAIDACLASAGAEPGKIGGLSFSSQMYGIFPLDRDGKPLLFNILWSDGRAEAQAARLKKARNAHDLYSATGCPMNSIYPLAKLNWIRETRPEIFAKAARFVSIKEYVLASIVGEWVVDLSLASATGLLDLRRKGWNAEALAAAGVEEGRLSKPVAGDAALPFRSAELLARWKLSPEVKVFPGGGDGPLANLGSGASTFGAVNIDLGTSGAARVVVDAPTADEHGSLWCYCLAEGRWVYGGILSNVGNAYQWLASNLAFFASEEPAASRFDKLNAFAEETRPGAEGVFFLPYLRKARSPYWNENLTGTIYGLRAGHDARHVTRALLEAIAYDLAEIVDIMNARGKITSPVILTGGLSKTDVVARILADVLEREILVPECGEGSIAGAAILALKGLGLVESLNFRGSGERSAKVHAPAAKNSAVYREARGVYRGLVRLFSDGGRR